MWKNTTPPLPNEISSLTNPTLRQRAEKAWKAGHTILNAIQAWDNWVNDSRVSYKAGKGYSIEVGDEISRDGATALRFLCSEQGAKPSLFEDENSPLLQNWPIPPSELLDKTFYAYWDPCDPTDDVAKAIVFELSQLHGILYREVCKVVDDLAYSPATALKQAAQGPVGGNGGTGGKGKKPSVNVRMLDLMDKKPECHTWSSQKFAEALGCKKSTVSETKAWKTLATAREMNRQTRAAKTQTRRQAKG